MRSRYYVETGSKELKKIFTKEEKHGLAERDVWEQIRAAGGAQYDTTVLGTNSEQEATNAFEWARSRLVWQEYRYSKPALTTVSFVKMVEVTYDDDGDEADYFVIKDAVAMPPEVCDDKNKGGNENGTV